MTKPKDMLTYRAPRSLDEAFPNTAEYGAAIERPCTLDKPDKVIVWGCCIALAALAALAIFGLI
jgi:hypothetical protein